MERTVKTAIRTIGVTFCDTTCQFFTKWRPDEPHCAFGFECGPLHDLKIDKRKRPIRCAACRRAEVRP